MKVRSSPPETEAIQALCMDGCCEGAVRRTYREMLGKGEREPVARNAALTVLQWHHPEIDLRRAKDTLALWLHEGTLH